MPVNTQDAPSIASTIWPLLKRLVGYGLIIILISQILMWDAARPGTTKFSEQTYTEWSQQFILLVMMVLFIQAARKYPQGSALSIILAGCAGIGLVREYNNFFNEQVFDGAWQLTASMVLLITVFFSYPCRKRFWPNLKTFRGSFSEGMMLAGFLTTFIFSRLFGRTTFWETLMDDRYFRSVKNAAEEGVELLGYTLLLLASIEYLLLLSTVYRNTLHEKR